MIREDLKQKSVRSGIFTMSLQAIESLFRIGSIAILARILMPEYFGLISMVTAITALAEQFKDLGLSTATIQNREITHEQVSNLFWINVVTSLVIMVIISSSSIFIARFYGEHRLIYITCAISTGFVCSGLTVQHQALLQRQMKLATIGVIQLAATLISTAIAIALAIGGYGYWALVWREVLRSLFIAVGTWILNPWIPDLPKKHVKISHLLTFGKHIAGFNIVVFLALNLDQILIGKFYGPAQLGLYRQAYYLVFFPVMQLVQPVKNVTEPALCALQDNQDRYRKYYMKMLTMFNFITMPLVLFLIVYAHDVVLVVLGKNWLEATDMFRILAISAFIRPASDTTGFLLYTCGKTKKYFRLGLVTALILMVSFSVGALWGGIGVAFGYLAATYAVFVLRLLYCFKDSPVNVRTFFKAIEMPLISSFVMMGILLALKKLVIIDNSLILLAMSLPLAGITYFLAWMMIRGGKENLREIIYDLIVPLHLDKYIPLKNFTGRKAKVL